MIEHLIDRYIQIRDRKAQLKAKYDNEVEALDDGLKKIENALLNKLDELGVDSFGKKETGLAFKSKVTSATVADWDSFLNYVKENDTWHMLDHRANKTAVAEFRAANDDIPPGINWREETVVRIRRG